jgi:hypothetical protein
MRDEDDGPSPWRWVFFAGLGLTSMVKGTGFGAALVASVVILVVAWDRDPVALRRLRFGWGWGLAAFLALTWPALVMLRHPSALSLWTMHVAGRLATHPEHFAGVSGWRYGLGLLAQTLPWTPLALVGATRSLGRAVRRRDGGDRVLWAWAVGPVALLSLATVKNAYYAIHALAPWSVWAALGLARLSGRWQARGISPDRLQRWGRVGFAGLGLTVAFGFAAVSPWFDRRGVEWAFYEDAGRRVPAGEPVALLYDDWDRLPYPTPFGPFPHDLAVRLYYLNRPACWRQGVEALAEHPPTPSPSSFAVIGRDRDLPDLRRLGPVETLARGPRLRADASKVDDRTFTLFRIRPARSLRRFRRAGRPLPRSAFSRPSGRRRRSRGPR